MIKVSNGKVKSRVQFRRNGCSGTLSRARNFIYKSINERFLTKDEYFKLMNILKELRELQKSLNRCKVEILKIE